jgi:CRP/FNR family transcriptional regulator, cyclic AMP receptor protein
VDLATAAGYCAATLVFLTFATRTMVPLRVLGIASNLAFIAYGWLQPAVPILVLHSVLLPMNAWRLHEMLRMTRQAAAASRSDLNLDWLRPYGHRRLIGAGELLFRKGDPADRMAFVLAGRFRVAELGVEIGPGELVGELGLVAPGHTRTRTVECTARAEVLEVAYDQVRQLYFQNPAFGFYFLELAARRLFDTIARQDEARREGAR